MNAFIICYTDAQSNQHFEQITGNYREWIDNHSDVTTNFVFNQNSDLVSLDDTAVDDFISQYERLDIPADYLGKTFIGQSGDTMKFIGIIAQNRKYKCRLLNMNTGKKFKATPTYVVAKINETI